MLNTYPVGRVCCDYVQLPFSAPCRRALPPRLESTAAALRALGFGFGLFSFSNITAVCDCRCFVETNKSD